MTRSTLHQGGHRLRVARRLVVARDGARCRRCGQAIDLRLPGTHPRGLTVGHVVAVADGGGDELANLAPEHRSCNLAGEDVAAARVARPPFFDPGT